MKLRPSEYVNGLGDPVPTESLLKNVDSESIASLQTLINDFDQVAGDFIGLASDFNADNYADVVDFKHAFDSVRELSRLIYDAASSR